MPDILLPGDSVRTPLGADQTGLPTKPGSSPTIVGTQSANRYADTFFDQHRYSGDPRFTRGRPWCGSRERAANRGYPEGFLGDLQPGEYIATGPDNALFVATQTREDRLASFRTAWDAPWMPKIPYFEFQWRAKRISIRYDRMKADFIRSRQQYYRAANRTAAQLGRRGVNFGEIPDMAVTDLVGFFDTREDPRIVDAAVSGDQWLLFGVGDVNVELAKLLQSWTDAVGYVSIPTAQPVVADPVLIDKIATALPQDLGAIIAAAIEAHEAKKKADLVAKMAAGKAKAAVARSRKSA